ncbi:MAG: ABC transporter substrate-binding protein [Sphaerochaetaceae bacterium]
MKKFLTTLLIFALALSVCFAGGGSEEQAAAKVTNESHIPEGKAPDGKIHLVFWTSMSGDSQVCTADAAKAFNASQDRYEVEVIYTSGILTKMLTSTIDDRPNMIHSSENNSAQYIAMTGENRLYVPVQVFIDYDKYNMSNIVDYMATIYTRNDEWQCVPYGNTSTGYFYNTDILSAHGIDVESLKSYEAIYNACVKLKAEGVAHPFFYRIHSDYLNYALTAEGIEYFNESNGRTGLPTASFFNEGKCHEATLAFFTFLKKMAQEDLLVDIETGNTDARNMFGQGDIAIMGGYSSGIDPTLKVLQEGVHFVFRPSPTVFASTVSKGQSPGGACIFICDVDDPWKEYGSWEFLKFFMQDEWTSKFAMASGYVPITKTGAKTPEYKRYIKERNPSAAVIIEALNNTPVGLSIALLPYAADYKSTFNNIFKKLAKVPEYTAQQAVDDLYSDTKDAIEMYFLSKGTVL